MSQGKLVRLPFLSRVTGLEKRIAALEAERDYLREILWYARTNNGHHRGGSSPHRASVIEIHQRPRLKKA